ncbi:single-stranded DNA-binding protein [Microbispora hainanensis]|uniref:Single-stranded DNA-binding protein n=1 Tax=Microbispora hainanensis TaxID=568844 RepID=A0A544YP05_9ACTN|nr:single-stranded DNA-binding protein [Microbispora hainanensis]TQS18511.1 single-stranded DNA-binding protein [Microbispora hainanensis]
MHRNEVVLAGRLSMEPAHRELPSGALLTQWRLAVRRPGSRSGHQRSDAIECATIDDGVRAMLAGWQRDDLVEVEGALRRRWWRGGSRYEIEVRTARHVEPAPPRSRPRRRTPQAADDGDGAASGIGRAGDAAEVPEAVTPEMTSCGDGATARVGRAGDGPDVPDSVTPEGASCGDGPGGSPAASSRDVQDDAVSAEPAGEAVSQS